MNRQLLRKAAQAPAPSGAGGVKMFGYDSSDTKAYEAGEVQTLTNVRQVGNQAVYRRSGNVWVASNAATADLEKLTQNAKTIDRFSDEYFGLVRANTVAENQVLATQQPGEELVIELRGQVYRIR
jgi:Ca-activated chloride channel family protein